MTIPERARWRALSQALAIMGLQFKLLLRRRIVFLIAVGWTLQLLVLITSSPGRSVDPSFGYRVTSGLADWLVILMAAGLIADDAERGTFSLVLSHPIERSTFMAGKLLSVVAIALLFSIGGVLATLGLMMRGDAEVTLAALAPRVAAALVLSLVRILVVTAATACLAVAVTNRYLASAGGFLYAYALSALIRRIVGLQDPWLGIADSFLPWRSDFDRMAGSVLSTGVEVGGLAAACLQPLAYAILLGFVAVQLLRRRDLVKADV